MLKFSTLSELLAAQPSGNVALRAPRHAAARLRSVRGFREIRGAAFERVRRRSGGSRGDGVAERRGDGVGIRGRCQRRHRGAAEPAYRADELDFYLRDLRAKVLLTHPSSPPVAAAVAEKLGLGVLELVPQASAAGLFEIVPKQLPGGARAALEGTVLEGTAQSDDIALILHTSGTTSRPKLVPLTQHNLCVSACNVRDTLALGPTDVGLNIMPLFHIHGLVAGLLAPLAAGSSVVCTPGFNASKFFGWLNEAKATWYTAVPTMHQAIVTRARATARSSTAAFRTLVVGVPAPASHCGVGAHVRCAARRGVRHDGSRASDDE